MQAENARRDREGAADFYGLWRGPNLFLRQGQERAVVRLLNRAGKLPFGEQRLLDVGCGDGKWLRSFQALGARPSQLSGIELDARRLNAWKDELPGADLRVGDGAKLPWGDAEFDLVTQFTVLTSVLDSAVRQQIAAEMLRVLKPGGAVVWLDFAFNNPSNKNVRGVPLKEVKSLFPGCEVLHERVTLAPPLARRLVPLSWTASFLLESLQVFNTHLACVIRRGP